MGGNAPDYRTTRAGSRLATGTFDPDCTLMLPLERQALEFQRLVERVRCEFLEMPGLRLTLPQAARLWGLDLPSCEAVVDALVRREFLQRTASGAVARIDG
jgi:hypothetical protein